MRPGTDPDAPHPGCPFCPPAVAARIVAACGSVVAIADAHPVAPGHHLLLPRRHARDWFELDAAERRDADRLIDLLRRRLLAADPSITGFNLGANCGAAAGQTIFHAHLHLIPRRDDDTPDPRGGVRGVIPGRMAY
jgi:diadenosine tetraphosphate (Ap4A) HIT family hydrolase